MARPLGLEYPGAWYPIMNRGRRGEVVFSEKGDSGQFIEVLRETVRVWKIRVAACCLRPILIIFKTGSTQVESA
jgi:hypothetical protein